MDTCWDPGLCLPTGAGRPWFGCLHCDLPSITGSSATTIKLLLPSKADVSRVQLTASNGHPIIGIIVVGALVFQPIGGLIHHYMYKKYQRRTIWATTHVWWGRIILTLGIINGGLGLMLSGNTVKGEIAYGVIAGVMWLIWMAVAIWGSRRSSGTSGETGEKAVGHSDATSDRYSDRDRMA